MAVSFDVPSSPKRNVAVIDEFLGVDFTNSPSNVDLKKSPNGINMIRDVPGKVRKCMGYETIKTYDTRINGAHFRHGDEEYLIHSGTKLYRGETVLYSAMKDTRSKSWQIEDKLYIADGKAFLVYDGTTVKKASENAYIPTLTIAKSPSGGGEQYEPLNLLQPGFTELFGGTATDKTFQLSFSGLDSKAVQAWVLNSSGTWVAKTEGVDFSVNRSTGAVTFTTAPGVSPVSGEDNVKITAYRTISGYADRINKCTIGILFGVNGAADRIFLSGNPDYINYDWYCDYNNPLYWPDTGYATLGTAKSAIIGYSIINDRLAAHKDNMEDDRNVILREGDITDNEPTFKIVNSLQGAGAVAPYSFAYLANEPLFLTELGIYAITPQDITGEKYSQNRSFFLNGKLLEEPNMSEAYACVFKDLYWLCLNNVAYILDGLQPLQTDKSLPYATRQYAGFYRTNLPARVMWVHDSRLYFGTPDGKICRFFDEPESLQSYNDNGVAIHAIWETPDFYGNLFYKNKTFRHLDVRLASAIATSVKIWVQKRGLWNLIKEDNSSARYFSFMSLVFSKLSFSPDTTPKTIPSKIKVKKVDKARFRFENDVLNEPFGLFDIALEYVENGYYKG
ncbi:MAG TPA: hypothetical protein IAB61_09310 [Candidatus Merdisoma merdipullorum]|nr:hypothetical protein [Candidatus Merdisoma merdipullorum]